MKNKDYDLVGTSMVLFSDKGERGLVNKKEVPTKRDLFYDVTFNHATIMMRSEVSLINKIVNKMPRRGIGVFETASMRSLNRAMTNVLENSGKK